MSDHKTSASQQNCGGVDVVSNSPAKGGPPADPERLPAARISVPFQLLADFVVETERAAEYLQQPDLDPQERSLFLAIINTPEALNRICRLAVVCALTEDSERHFKGKFMGPEPEDILSSILPYLPVDLQEYWTRLRRENCGCVDFYIDRIFQQFNSSLEKTQILDVSTGESIPLWTNSKIQPPL